MVQRGWALRSLTAPVTSWATSGESLPLPKLRFPAIQRGFHGTMPAGSCALKILILARQRSLWTNWGNLELTTASRYHPTRPRNIRQTCYELNPDCPSLPMTPPLCSRIQACMLSPCPRRSVSVQVSVSVTWGASELLLQADCLTLEA